MQKVAFKKNIGKNLFWKITIDFREIKNAFSRMKKPHFAVSPNNSKAACRLIKYVKNIAALYIFPLLCLRRFLL